MKKKIFVIGSMALLLCGCGKVPKLDNGEEALVTFKDNEKISVDSFYEEIKNSFGLQTFVNMVDKYIYEHEFKDDIKDAKDYGESAVKQFKANYDTEEQALQMLQNYYNYQTFEAYENAAYINYLQTKAIEAYVQDNISDDELKDYYEKNVYPNMTISHILVTPKVTDDMSDEDKKKAEDEAKEKINKVIDELKQAKKDNKDIKEVFANLAKEYSEDDGTKEDGGNLKELNIGTFNNKYDELVKAAAKLKDNDFSTEIITTESGYHVILKTATGEKKSYEDSLDDMKEKIANEKLNDSSQNQELYVNAIKHYRDKYEMDIIDSEIDSQYGRYMNNLINTAKSSK